MSIDNTPSMAEGSTSAAKVVKAPKMVDGREETKEERKARKAAKRAAKVETEGETAAEGSKSAIAGPEEVSSSTLEEPISAPTAEKSKKDKKRKRAAAEDTVSAPINAGSPKAESTPAEVVSDPQEEKRARKAARKAAKAAASAAAVGGPPPSEAVLEGSTTEASGSTLSEPARKALEYVRSYAATHLSEGPAPPAGQLWKFNKANQNWLIRNVWNESEVPEEHVDAVMAYLNTIKGGGRKALIEMAEKCSAAPITENIEPSPVVTTETKSEPVPSDTTGTTPSTTIPVTTITPIISPEEVKRDKEVIKARAEKLLLLLRA